MYNSFFFILNQRVRAGSREPYGAFAIDRTEDDILPALLELDLHFAGRLCVLSASFKLSSKSTGEHLVCYGVEVLR